MPWPLLIPVPYVPINLTYPQQLNHHPPQQQIPLIKLSLSLSAVVKDMLSNVKCETELKMLFAEIKYKNNN